MPAEVTNFRYRAFIVFSAADAQWADELSHRLEVARIPAALVGRETPFGPAPEQLAPIFRYSAAEGQGLSEEASAALSDSLFLVVLCSPNAAKSEYVDETLRRFKLAGRGERIIPVILSGEPRNEANECFPVALRYNLTDGGALSIKPDEPVAPLVIDARADAAGREGAISTLIASLAGLDPGDYLFAGQPSQGQAALAAASVVHPVDPAAGSTPADAALPKRSDEPVPPTKEGLAPSKLAAVSGEAAETIGAPDTPAAKRDRTEHSSGSLPRAEPFPASASATEAQRAAEAAANIRPPPAAPPAPTAKPAPRPRSRGQLIAVIVLLALVAGLIAGLRYVLPDNPAQLDRVLETGTRVTTRMVEVSESLGLPRLVTRGLVETNGLALGQLAGWGPDSPALRYRRAAMLLASARQAAALGQAGLAQDELAKASTLLGSLPATNPADAKFERDVALARLSAGTGLLAHGKIDEALKMLQPSFASLERRASASPGNPERQRDLSFAVIALGDALLAKGALDEAAQRFQQALAIRERLVVREPKNDAWRRELSLADERVGDLLVARGDVNGALKAYRTSLAMRLAAIDPEGSDGWKRQLAVLHNKIGDMLVARGALDEALNSYRAGLALALAAGGRDSAERRALSVSYERVGDVLRMQRAWDEALLAYRASLGIRERLAVAEPEDMRSERDLPLLHERIGDVLTGRGAVAEALAAYRTSLALRERLAEKDASNNDLQRDIAVSYNKIGDALAAQGVTEEALKAYRAGLAIREKLVAGNPGNAQLQWDLLVLQWRLASSGDDPGKRFALIVSTMRELAAKKQLTAEQAKWLAAAEQELARVQRH